MAFRPGVGNIATYSEGKLKKKIEEHSSKDVTSQALGGGISAMGFANAQVIDAPFEIQEGYNSLLFGPLTIKSPGLLYIGADSTVVIRDILSMTGSFQTA